MGSHAAEGRQRVQGVIPQGIPAAGGLLDYGDGFDKKPGGEEADEGIIARFPGMGKQQKGDRTESGQHQPGPAIPEALAQQEEKRHRQQAENSRGQPDLPLPQNVGLAEEREKMPVGIIDQGVDGGAAGDVKPPEMPEGPVRSFLRQTFVVGHAAPGNVVEAQVEGEGKKRQEQQIGPGFFQDGEELLHAPLLLKTNARAR